MIKAIILDVDGVIIGEKIGYNSPHPHPDVLQALKTLRKKNIPVVLCTAKPYYALSEIIQGANLHNPHITDAGAVIVDPIDDIVVEKHIIEKSLASETLKLCLENNVYTEFYTVDEYFIQENQASEITKKHSHILQKEPQQLQNMVDESEKHEITKIIPIALDLEDKNRVETVLELYKDRLSISWGVHPVALPLQFGIITALGSSKKEGAETIAKSIHVSFDEILGIGDSTSDWSFIKLCAYGATLENGSKEIKELISKKGEGKYAIGKAVDENGILDILRFFKLISN